MTERNDSLIEKLQNEQAKDLDLGSKEFWYNSGLQKAISIIRQHTSAPDAMERVTQAIKKVIHNSHGLWEPEDLANAAIAAMNMGDAYGIGSKDVRTTPNVCAPSPASDIASEMLDNEDVARFVYVVMQWAVRHAENGRYTPDWQEHGNSDAQEEARRCASVILNSKSMPVSVEDQLCALLHKAEDRTTWDCIAATLNFVRGQNVD